MVDLKLIKLLDCVLKPCEGLIYELAIWDLKVEKHLFWITKPLQRIGDKVNTKSDKVNTTPEVVLKLIPNFGLKTLSECRFST